MVAVPDLVAGGVMLSYRCTNACRHCLYRCSPRRADEWMSLEMAERVFAALAREPRLMSLHLAGGEATLRFDLLLETIGLARAAKLPLAYLETNAHWCRDRDETLAKLVALREAGLPSILVSASMFHNEFVPFVRTRTCVEAAREVFGPDGVLVWLPHLYAAIAAMPDEERTRSLPEFCERVGIPLWGPELPALYQVIPGGRAPEGLRRCFRLREAEEFRHESCEAELLSTTHFHVDHEGSLFTGMCAGLATGNVSDLHPEIDEEATPVLAALLRAGPCELLRQLGDRRGFVPDPEGYASKCDLCYRVRRHLEGTNGFRELRPADYYECS